MWLAVAALAAPATLSAQLPRPTSPNEPPAGQTRPPRLDTTTPEAPPPLPPGLQFPASYLPLDAGRQWTYDVELNGKKRPTPLIVECQKMFVNNFRSYYLFNQFPFAAIEVPEIPRLRYDRARQTFYLMLKDQDLPLWPTEGDQAVDYSFGITPQGKEDFSILKITFSPKLRTPLANLSQQDEVVLRYGVGITSAQFVTELGIEKYSLVKTEKIDVNAQLDKPKELVTREQPPAVIKPPDPYASSGPELTVTVETSPGKVKFTLQIQNNDKKMIPLTFDNDQSFDFLVSPAGSSTPLWQWSTEHYFSKVKRAEGLLPGETKEFSAEWRGRDSHHLALPAGDYQVTAVLTSKPEFRTPPIRFTFTPSPEQ